VHRAGLEPAKPEGT